MDIDDEDVETAAGLLAKALGKVPIPGSEATAHGLVLIAERAEGRRRRLVSLVVERERPVQGEDEPQEAEPASRRRGRRSDNDD